MAELVPVFRIDRETIDLPSAVLRRLTLTAVEVSERLKMF